MVSMVIVLGGIIALVSVERSFIKEATQEVVISQPKEIDSLIKGGEAPNFELNDAEGNKVKRSDFLNQPLVLMFWATWNNVSTDQVKILDDYLLSREGSEPFKLIAINSQENQNQASDFISRGGYKLDVLFDQNGEVSESYGVKTLPEFYFIDKDGVIKNLHIGPLSQDEMLLEAIPALR